MEEKTKSRVIFWCVLAISIGISWYAAQLLYVHRLSNVDQIHYYDGFMAGVDVLDQSYVIFRTDLENHIDEYIKVEKNQNGTARTFSDLQILDSGEVWMVCSYLSQGHMHQDLVRCNFWEEELETVLHLETMAERNFFAFSQANGEPQVFLETDEGNVERYKVENFQMIYVDMPVADALETKRKRQIFTNGEDGSIFEIHADGWIYQQNPKGYGELVWQIGGSREEGWNQDYDFHKDRIDYKNSKTGEWWSIDLTQKPYRPVLCERSCSAKTFDESVFQGEFYEQGKVKCGKLFLEDGRRVPAVCGAYEYVAEYLEKDKTEKGLFWIFLSVLYIGVFLLLRMGWRSLKKRHIIVPLVVWAGIVTVFLMEEGIGVLNEAILLAVKKSVETNNIRTCIQLGYESMSGYHLENIQKMCGYEKLTEENQLPYQYDISRYDGLGVFDVTRNKSFTAENGVEYRLYFQKEGEIYPLGYGQYLVNTPLAHNFICCDLYALEAMERALEERKVTIQQYEDLEGREYSVFIPFQDSGGDYPLLLEVAMSQNENNRRVAEKEAAMEKLLYVIAAVLTAAILIVLWLSMRPLGSLKEAAIQIIKGRLGAEALVLGHSEAAVTALYFNQMSRQLKEQALGSQRYQEKYEAFAPLWLLGASHPGEKLPAAKQGWYSSMVIKMGEGKPDFGPLLFEIHSRKGEVLSFDKGELWCLFTGTQEQAFMAALEILKLYKQDEKCNVTIAMDYEEICLGVIGDESRSGLAAFGTKEGETVFLRKCGEKYGVSLLITGRAAERIPEIDTRFHLRLLGHIWYPTSRRSEMIFEVLDGISGESYRRKLLTEESFQNGRRAFERGDFFRARMAFVEALGKNQEDGAALHYIRLCEEKEGRAREEGKGEKRESGPWCMEVYEITEYC